LEPGKLYTFKLCAADLKHLDSDAPLGMAVELDGVDRLEDLSFATVFRGGTSIGDFKSVHATLYRLVFRARTETARLTLSDWQSADHPGGQTDQHLACNYVLVRPYHATRPTCAVTRQRNRVP
jgi:hypothetical protein